MVVRSANRVSTMGDLVAVVFYGRKGHLEQVGRTPGHPCPRSLGDVADQELAGSGSEN